VLAIVDPKVSERQIAADLGVAPGSGEGSWHWVADAAAARAAGLRVWVVGDGEG
jgi:hypothetical protein